MDEQAALLRQGQRKRRQTLAAVKQLQKWEERHLLKVPLACPLVGKTFLTQVQPLGAQPVLVNSHRDKGRIPIYLP